MNKIGFQVKESTQKSGPTKKKILSPLNRPTIKGQNFMKQIEEDPLPFPLIFAF